MQQLDLELQYQKDLIKKQQSSAEKSREFLKNTIQFIESTSQVKTINEQSNLDQLKQIHETNLTKFVNLTFDDGTSYQGQIKNNRKHGQGKFYYKGGGYYDGHWHEDTIDGQGILYFQNNDVVLYKGSWKKGLYHGQGTLFNIGHKELNEQTFIDFNDLQQYDQYSIKYEGEFENGNKSGLGNQLYSNGEQFQGHFYNNQIYGEGQFITNKNEIIQGYWKHFKLLHKKQ